MEKKDVEMKRKAWIDLAKGIAILFVVLGHVVTSFHSSGMMKDSFVFLFSEKFAYSFHMPLFFVISGFLMKRINEKESVSPLIKKRVIAYGFPYLVFSFLSWCIKAVFAQYVNNPISIKELIMIPVYPISFLWFLYVILLSNIVHILFSLILKKTWMQRFYLIICLFLSLGANSILKIDLMLENGYNDLVFIQLAKNLFWFELGFYVVKTKETFLQQLSLQKTISCWCIISIFVFCETVIIIAGLDYVILNSVMNLLGVFCVILFSMIMQRNKILEYLGKLSLPIYLFHPYVVSAMKVLVASIKHPSMKSLGGIIPLLLCTFVGVLVPLVIYAIMTRFKWLDIFIYPLRYKKVAGENV